jgi:hypothetical protein
MGGFAVSGVGDDRMMQSEHYRIQPIDAWHLRALLTLIVHSAGRTVTVKELVAAVEASGFVLGGRASKVVSDSLRSPVARGWVRRVRRGRYAPGHLPKATKSRHRSRVRDARRLPRTAGGAAGDLPHLSQGTGTESLPAC